MKFGLHQNTIDQVNFIFEQFPEIETVLIYGSRAKGGFREGSDIDLSLKGNNLDENTCVRIHSLIEDLNTPYFFDITYYDAIENEALKAHIDRVGKLFYKNSSVKNSDL